MSELEKPPLGLRPLFIARDIRIDEITHAMMRYTEGGLEIPFEWIQELLDLRKCKLQDEYVKKLWKPKPQPVVDEDSISKRGM